jgi:hypothetical protein
MITPPINAPVALFAYARQDHLRLTVESLLQNSECSSTPLYVFCDGPRNDIVREQTDAVRAYADTLQGFASVTRIYRDTNRGLAQSIISGVGEVVALHGCVIVMEDDLVVSPHFLAYMNQGLQMYRDEPRVASIHGYSYPVEDDLPDTFFLRGADCWGWATWARAWQHFEPDGQKLLSALRAQRLTRSFDMGGAYPFTRMLSNQIKGKNNSWAVRWHASCFLANMLTLYPGKSLVNNIGMDGSGTHCSPTDAFTHMLGTEPIRLTRIGLQESPAAVRAFAIFLGRQSSPLARVQRGLTRLWNSFAKPHP